MIVVFNYLLKAKLCIFITSISNEDKKLKSTYLKETWKKTFVLLNSKLPKNVCVYVSLKVFAVIWSYKGIWYTISFKQSWFTTFLVLNDSDDKCWMNECEDCKESSRFKVLSKITNNIETIVLGSSVGSDSEDEKYQSFPILK